MTMYWRFPVLRHRGHIYTRFVIPIVDVLSRKLLEIVTETTAWPLYSGGFDRIIGDVG